MHFYSVYHLNLFYSSTEESQRPEVIQRCYTPLLELARSGVPIGIEATGATLEIIKDINPAWLTAFSDLLHDGLCELVGSGYSQIIGPLWPAAMNSKNLEIGNEIYEDLLGIKPRVALVNEQAYSAGLVGHYLDAGYKAILMEWDNPYRYHPEWDRKMRYFPQRAIGADGRDIPVIWNHSISFQKFQRFAHAETEIEEYLSYIHKQIAASSDGAFSVYGNDGEIFDFRPGRFHTEAPQVVKNEWERVGYLYDALRKLSGADIVLPSSVLSLLDAPDAGNRIHLETPQQPIPVKKQEKYNIVRWGLTGREDLMVNTLCYRIGKKLASAGCVDETPWKELLYFSGSDFRTHITEKRWQDFTGRLRTTLPDLDNGRNAPDDEGNSEIVPCDESIHRYSRFLEIRTEAVTVVLNLRKGMSFGSVLFKDAGPKHLIGTLPHGYYEDMEFGADFFSGHMVSEAIGRHKLTDLESVEPKVRCFSDRLTVTGTISLATDDIEKTVTIYRNEPRVDVSWKPIRMNQTLGVLRIGHITLNPEAFCRNKLFWATHNGGYDLESFRPPRGCIVEHGRPVSFMVSASQALGLTEGLTVMGDDRNRILIRIRKETVAALGLMTFRDILDSWFCRLSFSLQEFDDTSKQHSTSAQMDDAPFTFSISITHECVK